MSLTGSTTSPPCRHFFHSNVSLELLYAFPSINIASILNPIFCMCSPKPQPRTYLAWACKFLARACSNHEDLFLAGTEGYHRGRDVVRHWALAASRSRRRSQFLDKWRQE
ncbi:hypothetical protein BDZ89DRAFT_9213 [Hymenopellis radicata]|nr:hypothetical protein BDZ89DRAFT_9213 [Hymenopellis radicata]